MPRGAASRRLAEAELQQKICTAKDCIWEGSLQPVASFYVRKNGTLDAICKDCRKMRSRMRYEEQNERIREQQATYRNSPRVKRRKYDRSQRRDYHRQYNQSNRARLAEQHREYLQTAEGSLVARWAGLRRAVRMLQNGGSHTDAEWMQVQVRQQGRCAYCGRLCDSTTKGLQPTKDHIIAIARGGSNAIENIVLACWDCNTRKGDKEFWQPHMKIG